MRDFPLILRLDASGMPINWMPWQDAVLLYCRDMVAWNAGQRNFTIYGGVSRRGGCRSRLEINSIVAVRHALRRYLHRGQTPPLNNRELFRRDAQLCMYCGVSYSARQLTRDHVVPISRGGRDSWSNVVTACLSCNTRKGGRTPEQAGMMLLAIPYKPNWAEYLALSNRRILADQMSFLKPRFRNPRRADSLHG